MGEAGAMSRMWGWILAALAFVGGILTFSLLRRRADEAQGARDERARATTRTAGEIAMEAEAWAKDAVARDRKAAAITAEVEASRAAPLPEVPTPSPTTEDILTELRRRDRGQPAPDAEAGRDQR